MKKKVIDLLKWMIYAFALGAMVVVGARVVENLWPKKPTEVVYKIVTGAN